jgi:histidinol-phosphate aminotransferase
LFAKHPSIPGDDLYQKVKAQGLLIRHFNTPGIEDFVRITIGTAEQMSELRKTFEGILRG